MKKFPVSTSFDTFVSMKIIAHRFWDCVSSDSHCSLSLWALEVCAGASTLSGSQPACFLYYSLWEILQVSVGWVYKHTQVVLDWMWPCPTVTSVKIEVLHPYIAIVIDALFRKQKMLLFSFFSEFLKTRCRPICQENLENIWH